WATWRGKARFTQIEFGSGKDKRLKIGTAIAFATHQSSIFNLYFNCGIFVKSRAIRRVELCLKRLK
ncbi:MAG: hypothetical protein R6X34_02740, partial [Chloroflexota bacterium]